jgi:flagellar basal-body rod protein FlgB
MTGREVSMTGIQLFDGMYDGLEKVLDLRSRQHALTATNLANANTPGFKARELDFDSMLNDMMERSVNGEKVDESEVQVTEKAVPPWVRDGNSVDAEHEAAKLSENSLLYNAVATGTSRRLELLQFAASDGK